MTVDPMYEQWLQANPPPDLQVSVDKAGRRYTASIGETYIEDPFRRAKEAPHQGGYRHIRAANGQHTIVRWRSGRSVDGIGFSDASDAASR
jgi:hypothetical protein